MATKAKRKSPVRWTAEERTGIYKQVYDRLVFDGAAFPLMDHHGLAEMMHKAQKLVIPSSTRWREYDSLNNRKQETEPLQKWLNEYHGTKQKTAAINAKKVMAELEPVKPAKEDPFESFTKRTTAQASLERLEASVERLEGMMKKQAEQATQLCSTMDRLNTSILAFTKLMTELATPQATPQAAQPEAPKASIGDIPTATKPKVVVYALAGAQQADLEREFGDMLELKMISPHSNMTVERASRFDRAFIMMKASGPFAVKTFRREYGSEGEVIAGSVSQLKTKIHEFLEAITS